MVLEYLATALVGSCLCSIFTAACCCASDLFVAIAPCTCATKIKRKFCGLFCRHDEFFSRGLLGCLVSNGCVTRFYVLASSEKMYVQRSHSRPPGPALRRKLVISTFAEPLPQGSKDSSFKAFGPKDHSI